MALRRISLSAKPPWSAPIATRRGETGGVSRFGAGSLEPLPPSARSTASRTSFRTSFSLGVRMGRGSLAETLTKRRARSAGDRAGDARAPAPCVVTRTGHGLRALALHSLALPAPLHARDFLV